MRLDPCLRLLAAGLAASWLAAGGPAAAQTTPIPLRCDNPDSVRSRPGEMWWKEQRWRYADDAAAERAYAALAAETPPWPDWFVPMPSVVQAGTRFQMALAPGQPETSPGGFGTFDNIESADEVRDYLAVIYKWKPQIDRVVTYEVTQAFVGAIGPVGPQVDPTLCTLLPGRWSQVNMLMPGADRMKYLKVLNVRTIPGK